MKADEFKVGDEVHCIFYGKGECIKIEEDDRIFPVTIKFETGRILSYTKDGRYLIDGIRTLFFEEIKIPESAYKRPKWRAKEGEFYFLVDTTGDILKILDSRNFYDDKKFKIGNYFKTEEEAKESKFYKVFHEED